MTARFAPDDLMRRLQRRRVSRPEPPAQSGRSRIRPAGILLAALAIAGTSFGVSWVAGSQRAAATVVREGRDGAILGGTLSSDDSGPPDVAAIDAQIRIWGPK